MEINIEISENEREICLNISICLTNAHCITQIKTEKKKKWKNNLLAFSLYACIDAVAMKNGQ